MPGYKENTVQSAVFYVSFNFLVAFFIMNLFVGVIISAFNKERDRLGKNFLLTESQRKKIETKILVMKMRPKFTMLRPKQAWRNSFFDLS